MNDHKLHTYNWLISPLFIMEKLFPHWRRRKISYHLQDTMQEKSLCFQKKWQLCHYLLAIGFQLTYYNRLKSITIGMTLILLGGWYKNLHLKSPAKKIIYLFSWDEIRAFSENSLGNFKPGQFQKLQVQYSRCYGDAKGGLDSPVFNKWL